jgi:DNA-binding NtrC family response regulator
MIPAVFHILILDDDSNIACTTEAILRATGYEAHAFSKGWDAIAYASNNAPDVALLAVVPGHGDNIDGASVGIEILKAAMRCSVLLFSGHAEAMNYTARAAEKGYPFELLTKPILPKGSAEQDQRDYRAWLQRSLIERQIYGPARDTQPPASTWRVGTNHLRSPTHAS